MLPKSLKLTKEELLNREKELREELSCLLSLIEQRESIAQHLRSIEVRPISTEDKFSLTKEDILIRENELREELSFLLSLIAEKEFDQVQERITHGPFELLYRRYEELRLGYQQEEEEIERITKQNIRRYTWTRLPNVHVSQDEVLDQIKRMHVPVDLSYDPKINDLSLQLDALKEDFTEEERRQLPLLTEEYSELQDQYSQQYHARQSLTQCVKKALMLMEHTETLRTTLEKQQALFDQEMQWLEGSSTTTPWYVSKVRKMERKLLSFQERYDEALERENSFVTPNLRSVAKSQMEVWKSVQMTKTSLRKLVKKLFPLQHKEIRTKNLEREITKRMNEIFFDAEKVHIQEKMDDMYASLRAIKEEERKREELSRRRKLIIHHTIHFLLESEEGEEYIWMEDALDVIQQAF